MNYPRCVPRIAIASCSGSCRTNSPVSPGLDVAFERCCRTGPYDIARLMRERGDLKLTEFGELTTCRRLPAFQGDGMACEKSYIFRDKVGPP
jgi:hypothetical protein